MDDVQDTKLKGRGGRTGAFCNFKRSGVRGNQNLMHGQASVEFLMLFTATLAVIAVLAAALLAQRGGIEAKAADVELIARAEAAAQAVEAMLNSGVSMSFDFREEGVEYAVEGNRFHVIHDGKVIEIGGVFSGNATEPA